MSSLFEDVSSCQKKIQDTALYKENNSLWKQNAQNFVFSFCFWFVYALIFKHCEKKTRCNSIFFSDIHSKVLRSVRITFFVLHLKFFSDCCFSALLLNFFWADSKINDAKFNQNKKHYLDVTPKRLLIPNCLFFCVLKQCFAILFILLAHNPPPWKILLWNWSK